jgi:uncharacterized protein (UPF0333 family)
MDERTLKRLLIIVAASIILIWVFKSMMLKTAVSLNKVAAEKKQAAAAPQYDSTPEADVTNVIETPAASAPGEVATLELPVASGVGEGR